MPVPMSKPPVAEAFVGKLDERVEAPGVITFTFMPRLIMPARRLDRPPERVPLYLYSVDVRGRDEGMTFEWHLMPDVPPLETFGFTQQELEDDIRDRIPVWEEWRARVNALVDQLEQWARDHGWATKRVPKTLSDKKIGEHKVTALLMQQDTIRALLEPVSRTAAGVSGLVDLYLMPGYDDVANLYYQDGVWRIQYDLSKQANHSASKEDESKLLSQGTFTAALGQMRQHGG